MDIREISERAFDAGQAAYQAWFDGADHHPCLSFVEWQSKAARRGPFRFQMPEPFSGRLCELGIAIVGPNPGYRADEEPFPDHGWGPDSYFEFFVGRFDMPWDNPASIRQADGSFCPRRQPHWSRIEGWFRTFIEDFRLGCDARLIETIRFKSLGLPRRARAGHSKAPSRSAWNCAFRESERAALIHTVQNIGARIFVTLGTEATSRFHSAVRLSSRPKPINIGQPIVPRPRRMNDPILPEGLVVIPIFHPSEWKRRFDPINEQMQRARETLIKLLEPNFRNRCKMQPARSE